MELYWIIAYQFVYIVGSLVLIRMMFMKKFEKHTFNMYYLFGQFAVIRLCIPLLNFEDRKSYMNPIEISSLITNQVVILILDSIAAVYLKYNIIVIMINSLAVSVVVAIGTISMLSVEDTPAIN